MSEVIKNEGYSLFPEENDMFDENLDSYDTDRYAYDDGITDSSLPLEEDEDDDPVLDHDDQLTLFDDEQLDEIEDYEAFED